MISASTTIAETTTTTPRNRHELFHVSANLRGFLRHRSVARLSKSGFMPRSSKVEALSHTPSLDTLTPQPVTQSLGTNRLGENHAAIMDASVGRSHVVTPAYMVVHLQPSAEHAVLPRGAS